ncbi:MAG: type II 3-dehydroquinate dehydratase [Verrucomicrobiota bacterium]
MESPKKIAVVNGPNLNWLGQREPEIYGKTTLDQLEQSLKQLGSGLGLVVDCFQSNSEGTLVDYLYQFKQQGGQGIVINAAAFTHTSVALRDCLAGIELPAIEVHISNIYKRESFRKTSYTAPICVGVITGLGTAGYRYALEHLAEELRSQ